jgi:hypothetical protein
MLDPLPTFLHLLESTMTVNEFLMFERFVFEFVMLLGDKSLEVSEVEELD